MDRENSFNKCLPEKKKYKAKDLKLDQADSKLYQNN